MYPFGAGTTRSVHRRPMRFSGQVRTRRAGWGRTHRDVRDDLLTQQPQIAPEVAQLRPQRGELAGEPREQRRIDGGSHDFMLVIATRAGMSSYPW